LRLSRNFGHQIAVTAGLEEAVGNAVVIIDADLQDPPEMIPEMIHRWREGNHVVYGVRAEREGESRFKLWTAKVFYRIINRLSDTKIPVDAGDFRLLDRKVVEVLKAMPERARFLRGMVSWAGFRQSSVTYQRAARHAGESKYPLGKMVSFALDGIISFSLVPLKIAIWTGFLAIWGAVAGIIVAIVDWILDKGIIRGWASLFVAVLFMGGIQLVSLGIIGEYLGRIYTEVKRRPLYAVEERLGFSDGTTKEKVVKAGVNVGV
ncbi:MAG TPA: glycosyltransferase, partial [Pyrinomonadaceae bacterium]|nr:glycosyltransferase [Pyrinomonadaceae bacterium]